MHKDLAPFTNIREFPQGKPNSNAYVAPSFPFYPMPQKREVIGGESKNEEFNHARREELVAREDSDDANIKGEDITRPRTGVEESVNIPDSLTTNVNPNPLATNASNNSLPHRVQAPPPVGLIRQLSQEQPPQQQQIQEGAIL